MFKLLLLLAAVAALAVAAPLAAPDFNTLDVSDDDASDNDASDDDASDLDGIDADDLLEVTDERIMNNMNEVVHDNDDFKVPVGEIKNSTIRTVVDQYAIDDVVCQLDEYLSRIDGTSKCTSCPSGHSVPYDESLVADQALCQPCPFILESCSRTCITTFQKNFMATAFKGNPTLAMLETEKKIVKSKKQRKSGKKPVKSGTIDMSPQTPYEAKQEREPAPTVVRVVKGDKSYAFTEESAGVTNVKNMQPAQVQLQTTSCETGLTCCLPGYYGTSSASCTLCPSAKPSSPFSAPNSNCECPNSGSHKCFACNNKCRPYSSQSRMCLPYQCPSGQTCKTVNNAATCV